MRRLAPYLLALVFSFPALAAESDCAWIYEDVGKPLLTKTASSPPDIELCRTGYLLSYDPEAKLAHWVMERLTPEELAGDANRHQSRFKPDPALPEGARAKLADYRGSGFDRGHLAPAADFKADQAAMDESFYLSNTAPQVGVGFNRHLWRDLEAAVREEARGSGGLYVVTGLVVLEGAATIGGNRIPVPSAFYKAIYDPRTGETRAWLVPNRAHPGVPYTTFEIPLGGLETLTGLDFWPGAPP